MSPHWLHLLALVATIAATAHGQVYAPNQNAEAVVVSHAALGEDAKAAQLRRNLDEAVAVHTLPVLVQDWSLMCKQLCGAGLGGVACAPYCTSVDTSEQQQQKNADVILSPNNENVCKDLCTLQFGGVHCGCHPSQSIDSINEADYDIICRSFCEHNSIKLDGCSPCSQKLSVHVNSRDVDDGDSVNQIVVFDAVQTTTPDWNQLCESLCKTGDGGSLCNCDLSPFSLKLSN